MGTSKTNTETQRLMAMLNCLPHPLDSLTPFPPPSISFLGLSVRLEDILKQTPEVRIYPLSCYYNKRETARLMAANKFSLMSIFQSYAMWQANKFYIPGINLFGFFARESLTRTSSLSYTKNSFCDNKLHGDKKNICCVAPWCALWYFWKRISECLLDRRRRDNTAAGYSKSGSVRRVLLS